MKKVCGFIFSLWMLSLVVFFMSRLAPGDPLMSFYGDRVEKMSVEERWQAEERLGLHDRILTQYIRWGKNALCGDFGISYKYKKDVLAVVGERIPNTLLLGGSGFLLIFALSLPLGAFCARREDKWQDRLLCSLGTISGCIPEFWFSLLLIFVFSVSLKLLPGSGAYTPGSGGDIPDRLRHLILPLTVVVISHLWYYAYLVRNLLLVQLRCDYVLLARSKGLNKRQVLYHHCMRNILPSYFGLMAASVSHILGGTYVVETVFSYPGIGTLAYESVRYQDYNLLMVVCLLSGGVVLFCSMLGKILGEKISPRIAARGTWEKGD